MNNNRTENMMTTVANTGINVTPRTNPGWYRPADCKVENLVSLTRTETSLADFPYADEVVENVLIYGHRVADRIDDQGERRSVQTELAKALISGPGIVVFKGAFDLAVIDRATAGFQRLIQIQRANGSAPGDHFAKPGENDRVWGALDKLALIDPSAFVDYYANDLLALICESWLGPNYRITSQLNVVNPGGRAQTAHRDYHLGIQNAQQYPAHVHAMSVFLTLQGAVAHVDMPVESGPTMYLPYSQQLPDGFVAVNEPEFASYFNANNVQLPLSKGDAVFFNPGLFHGAGTNRTSDIRRMANLLQVSSGFGRAIEAVDTTSICKAVYLDLTKFKAGGASPMAMRNIITAAAEGYPFPTNLDRDLPGVTLAPPSQADVVQQAVEEGWTEAQFFDVLDAQQHRRKAAPVVTPQQA